MHDVCENKNGDDITCQKFFVEFLLIEQMCGNTVNVNKNYAPIILFRTNGSIARYIINVFVQHFNDKNVKATQDDAVAQR